MAGWSATRSASVGGRWRILITPPGGSAVDVTFFRDVPTKLSSYSSADPFSDAVAVLEFPQMTAWDDPMSAEASWLVEDSDVDIWWIPAYPVPDGWPTGNSDDATLYSNPLTGNVDLVAPAFVHVKSGDTWVLKTPLERRGTKVFEGFIANLSIASNDQTESVTAQCQGALFQLDQYKAKPFYPPNPQTLESLIIAQFDKSQRPNLRTHQAFINWPGTWTKVAPAYTGDKDFFDTFAPNVKPGKRWTGYTTRQTGSWDNALTSFIQNLLAVMLVKPNSGTGLGTSTGSQWTLRMLHEGASSPSRRPMLTVRDTNRPADFSLWISQPGVTVSLERDATQKVDAIYGDGTDRAGTTWRNAVVAGDGSRTDYKPLAATPQAWPASSRQNPCFRRDKFVRETYMSFGTGFAQTDAVDASQMMLARDNDPGWSGSITLATDPSESLSRWELTAGMVVKLKGFRGTGANGVRFHIAQCQASPEDGTVTLTVDTRFRDLLTLQQALNRTLDPLTPAKLLQLGRNSVTIEDIQAPWSYSHGSGCIPKPSVNFKAYTSSTATFPFADMVQKYPPRHYPHLYAHVDANNPDSKKRWTKVPILMSERGTIRRTELAAFDIDGNLLKIPFHMSLYYYKGISYAAMPHLPQPGHPNQLLYSPFIPNAFETIDPSTGQTWRDDAAGHKPAESFIIGWGNKEQPAGYSPGLKSAGTKPTGLLVDDSTWDFDCTQGHPNYPQLAAAGKVADQWITIYAMLYAEYTRDVFFMGRLFRQEPGTSS